MGSWQELQASWAYHLAPSCANGWAFFARVPTGRWCEILQNGIAPSAAVSTTLRVWHFTCSAPSAKMFRLASTRMAPCLRPQKPSGDGTGGTSGHRMSRGEHFVGQHGPRLPSRNGLRTLLPNKCHATQASGASQVKRREEKWLHRQKMPSTWCFHAVKPGDLSERLQQNVSSAFADLGESRQRSNPSS